MTRSRFLPLSLVVVAAAVVVGCRRAEPPVAAGPDPAAVVRPLEARVAKLEQALQAATSARDQLQLRLTAADDGLRREQARGKQVEAERNDARAALAVRTTERDDALTAARTRLAERDAMGVQFDVFRKNLRELLGQADLAAGRLVVPTTPTAANELPPPGGL